MSGSNAEVALPEPLTPSDAAAIRRIMALQDSGNLTEAGRLIANLENPILMGTILAQRYLGRFHRSTVPELSDWLSLYADLPDATAIHALLLKRLPSGTVAPPRPMSGQPLAPPDHEAGADDLDADSWPFARNASLDRAVIEQARAGETKAALRLIGEIRRQAPAVHKWTGRVYVFAAFAAGLGGLALIAMKGAVGGWAMTIGSACIAP